MSTAAHATRTGHLSARLANGAIAGIAGGIAFGILMAMMGMLPMVGMLIGVNNAAIGFVVHLVNSAIIGAIFAALTRGLADKVGPLLSAGVVYGVAWWVLGALLIMPLWLSITADPMMRDMVFHVGRDQWLSLMGHIIYGLVTAAVLVGLRRRALAS